MTDEQTKVAVGLIAATCKTIATVTEVLSKTAAALAEHAKAMAQLAGTATAESASEKTEGKADDVQ